MISDTIKEIFDEKGWDYRGFYFRVLKTLDEMDWTDEQIHKFIDLLDK